MAGAALVALVASSGLWLGWRSIESEASERGYRSALCAALAEDVPGVGVID